ncbi:MAG: hypothetical protein ACI4AM_01305 [Muribaculaceae bacterium]
MTSKALLTATATLSKALYIRDEGAFFRNVKGGSVRNVVFERPLYYSPYNKDADGTILYHTAAIVSLYARDASFVNIKVQNAIVDAYHIELFGGILATNRTSWAFTTDDIVVSKCSFDSYVILRHSAHYFGGIVGSSQSYDTNWIISDCTVSGEMTDHATFEKSCVYFGGIMAFADNNVNISKCASTLDYTRYTGATSTLVRIGGIVGCSIHESELAITECANLGSMSFINSKIGESHLINIGGIAGYLYGTSSITNCANLCPIDTQFSDSGGISGWTVSNLIGAFGGEYSVNNCVVACVNNVQGAVFPVEGFNPVCAEIWYTSSGTFSNTYFYEPGKYPALDGCTECTLDQLREDAMIQTLNTTAGSTVWGRLNNSESFFNGLPLPISLGGVVSMLEGAGTSDSPYLIYNEAELREVVKAVNGGNSMEDKYFRLAANIEMSSETLASIGTMDYPFKGVFDGGGNYISGIVSSDGSMFGYLAGTVKNLALFDFTTSATCSNLTPLAALVGGSYSEYGQESSTVHQGTVEQCYVLADLSAGCDASTIYSNSNQDVRCTGLCGSVYEGSTIADCYFIGSLSTSLSGEAPDGWTPTFSAKIGGLVVNNYGTVQRSFAIFDASTFGDFNATQLYGICCSNSATVDYCFYMSDNDNVNVSGTRVSSYAELNSALSPYSAWGEGQQLPYLLNAKHYEVNVNSVDTAIDGARLPLTEPNFIRSYCGDSDETRLWTLPNMAIYRADTHWVTVTNLDLVPGYDFVFTSQSGFRSYGSKGSLTYPLELDGRKWYGLCLPCQLSVDDLPEGSELYYVGRKGEGKINMEKVNDISAGRPCVAYIEGSGTLVLHLSGKFSSIPRRITTESDVLGLFKNTELTNAAVFEVDADGNPIFKHYDNITAAPFSIYLEETATDMEVVSREELYLDSSYNGNTNNINLYVGQPIPVVVRASFPAGQWNPIVLPFDVSVEDARAAFGSDYAVEDLKFIHYDSADDGLTLFFGRVDLTNMQCPLQAGKPYLIKPSTDFVSGKEFTDVSVTNEIFEADFAGSSSSGDFTLQLFPSYDSGFTALGEGIVSFVYDAEKDKFTQILYYKAAVNGLLFYIKTRNFSPKELNIYHDVTSGVESPTGAPAEVVGIYDLSGRRLTAPQRGVNILLMSDGSARKIIVNQ